MENAKMWQKFQKCKKILKFKKYNQMTQNVPKLENIGKKILRL